ncbi:MAG: hypothetical protein C0404_05915 [Verrucomicrobia bacterium]|nr:hypothetical protein [Verrucomicrobiota bacterium]
MSNDKVMIIAPHPDDETLACAGVIMRTKRAGGSVRVVFLTNGDGFAKAAAANSGKEIDALAPADFLAVARSRQGSALNACGLLGLLPQDIFFLSYPDGGLATIMSFAGAEVFTQEYTNQSCTYGLLVPDYHSQAHGQPAPYSRDSMLADVGELVKDFAPGAIYVTDAADGHGDHSAAFGLVREAAADSGFKGDLFTYLIHSSDGSWPTPRGADPSAAFESGVADGKKIPAGVRWPPDVRCPMTRDESKLKLNAIRAYTLEMRLAGHYIESFIKSEEVFWQVPR